MRLGPIGVVALAAGQGLCLGQSIITTVAGTGTCCSDLDGVPATSAYLQGAEGLVFGVAGNLYIWETQPSRIRLVNAAGTISTVAGFEKNPGFSGDGGQATKAQLLASTIHSGLAWDSVGNLYIADGGNHRIRKVSPAGVISTVAGNGAPGYSGDGGPATNAMLFSPTGIAVDRFDNLYIADESNRRIRKVTPAGVISTVAGNGNVQSAGDGGPAISASFPQPRSVAVDGQGNLYIAEVARIRKVNAAGIISTLAGTGTRGLSGDGGPATSAQLSAATGMAIDSGGNLYFADTSNQRVRKVDAAGRISTIAGTTVGFSGDGGPAANAQLRTPHDVVLDAAGNLYVSDTGNNRIRKISAVGPALVANPSQLSFSFAAGGVPPASQSVSVTAPVAPLTFSAAVSSGSDWLSVTPAGGTTPATLSVSVNTAGRPRGVYQGSVTVTVAGGPALVFAVTLTVTGADAPLITSVVNASGYQSTLAPGALFRVSGSGLGGNAESAAPPPGYPTSLGGTSLSFTSTEGNGAVDALILTAAEGQVVGLLPSTVKPGIVAVRATYNGLTSAAFNVTVAARSLGIDTLPGKGTGPAKASLENVNGGSSQVRLTSGSTTIDGQEWTLTPAHPGDTVVLTGTGGGADLENDAGGSSGDQSGSNSITVILAGREIAPSFAGTLAGYPGVWVVKFVLPEDIAPGCFLPVAARTDGVMGNQATIAIAAAGESTCPDSQLNQESITLLDSGGVIALGGFGVSKATSTTTIITTPGAAATVTVGNQENIGGGIGRYTAAQYAAIFSGTRYGACTLKDRTAAATEKPPSAPDSYLDAGATIPAAGPGLRAASALSVVAAGPIYSLLLANGTIVGGGEYTLAGAGGKDLGAFQASVPFPVRFSARNWDSITLIDRAKPFTVEWDGEGLELVNIIITTARVTGKNAAGVNVLRTVSIDCRVPAAAGAHAVPAEALAKLLPEGIDAASMATGSGILVVEGVTIRPFSAPLTGGGQTAYAAYSATLAVSKNLIVQ